MYSADLAHIHAAGFGAYAREVAPAIERIVRQAGFAGGRVVECGCGNGTLAAHLERAGYGVSAFDVSPAMIRLARRNAPGVRFSVASVRTARLPRCDAIVSVGEVLTYVPGGAPALGRFFAKAHDALVPGGVLVFDFIESARQRTYDTKSITGRDWALAVKATFSESRQILTRRMTILRRIRPAASRQAGRDVGERARRSRETHRIRVYRRDVIQRLLRRCGFSVTMSRAFGRHRLLPGDVAVIARKTSPG